MKYVLFTILSLGLIQTASAFQFREYDFAQIDCIGSNGVTYTINDYPGHNLIIETALGNKTKTFYGNFFVTTYTNNLVVTLSQDKSGYMEEYQIIVPVAGVKAGIRQSVGSVLKVVYAARYPISSVTCQFTMNK